MPGRGPIFIVSAMGSGSTLLRLILDSHERIAIPQETGFMRMYNAHQFVPLKWSGRNWALRMGWSREELDAELAGFYARLFRRHAEQQGKARWGDKTPLHTWHVDAMARLYPDASFVGVVRHPGAAVASNLKRFGHSFDRAVTHVLKYDREVARQAARHADRFAVVRYEDLVARPEPLLRELLDWLEEPWSDRVLRHHDVQGARVVEGRTRTDDPIDVSRIGAWQRTLPEGRRRAVRRRLGRLAEFYGYSMDDPAALAPLAPGGALLVRGADLAARMDAFADLDLPAQPVRPLAERFYHPGRVQLYRVARTPGGRAAPPVQPAEPLARAWSRVPEGVRERVRGPARRIARRLRP